MTEAIIYRKDPEADTPGTHALVIGIGSYPYLVGGSVPHEEKFRYHEGMGQLSSPPLSARSIANWLLTGFANPEKPLASLAMLVSEKEIQPFGVLPKVPEPVTPPTATIANIDTAIRAWKQRGDAHADNLMLFFFSGHGVSQGTDQVLLSGDFGGNIEDPFAMAIHFEGLYAGMEACMARRQCYFIDTCRSPSSTLIETYRRGSNAPAGLAIIRNIGNAHPGERLAPCFFSTLLGKSAYSRGGRETVFAEALLQSLKGCGSYENNEYDSWRVSTNSLQLGIEYLLGRDPEKLQRLVINNQTTFDLHYLAGPPQIPVTIRCLPKENNRKATLSYMLHEEIIASRPPNPSDWETAMTIDDYTFMAQFAEQRVLRKQAKITPPHHYINLREA